MFQSTKFPRMKAVVWFHTNKEKDWRIDSSSGSLTAFKNNLTGVSPPPPDQPPEPPPPPAGQGKLTVGAPQPDKQTYKPGEKITARASLKASGGDVQVQRAVITARAPGSTHAGGPYYDLSPDAQGVTVKDGSSLDLSGTLTLPSDAKVGDWDLYTTWCDPNNNWADGPSDMIAIGTAAPTTGIKAGDRVKVMNERSRFYQKTGMVRSVNSDRGTAMVRLGGESSARMFYLRDIKKI
jgi:hypothetical protein